MEEELKKTILITNGSGKNGKDTFAGYIKDLKKTRKVSSIDFVKNLVIPCTRKHDSFIKGDKYRKLLSDIKKAILSFNEDFFVDLMLQEVEDFKSSDEEILIVDIREPEEIDKFKLAVSVLYNIKVYTVLIVNENIPQIISNSSDANVYDYAYDYLIDNNADLYQLQCSAETLLKQIGYEVGYEVG